ncbi:hypothetical protein B9479_007673 [Cryptococcus floricola]|uniref:Uncharacterized protein n=1 Tax=Cryptococcus floricola TaxID=2591691 RepID=A0A5D3AJL2_9TREE|nr:hypothetical protein B9479_007673 [Cryptococcus floricola]
MPPSTANNPSQSDSLQTIVYIGLKKYYDFILFWTDIVVYTLTIVVLATLDSSTCPVPRLQMSADGARLAVNLIVYCFLMPSPPGRSSQQGGQQPLVLGMTRLQKIKIASAVIFTVFGFTALMLQIAHTASVERHEACLSAILCPGSYSKSPCTGVQGQFCRKPSVNPTQALIKDNIRTETIDGGYRFDFDADVEPHPNSTSDFVVVGGCNWTYLTVLDVLPAANETRFQVPVEAAFNCSSSEKLSLGIVVRIAETEKAKELERGDRIRVEEKKGLTKIVGAEKGSW